MILLIDTSQEIGTVAIESDGKVLFSEENKIAKEHAAWLHSATGRILNEAKMTLRELEAIAVVAGPGSYTGLRVGMAAAKGFCYALKIPLITRNTLEIMGVSMAAVAVEQQALICPMIDARREEVYTALYHPDGEEIQAPRALILDKNSFEEELQTNRIIFFGSGAKKWEKINRHTFVLFLPQPNSIQAFAKLAEE